MIHFCPVTSPQCIPFNAVIFLKKKEGKPQRTDNKAVIYHMTFRKPCSDSLSLSANYEKSIKTLWLLVVRGRRNLSDPGFQIWKLHLSFNTVNISPASLRTLQTWMKINGERKVLHCWYLTHNAPVYSHNLPLTLPPLRQSARLSKLQAKAAIAHSSLLFPALVYCAGSKKKNQSKESQLFDFKGFCLAVRWYVWAARYTQTGSTNWNWFLFPPLVGDNSPAAVVGNVVVSARPWKGKAQTAVNRGGI